MTPNKEQQTTRTISIQDKKYYFMTAIEILKYVLKTDKFPEKNLEQKMRPANITPTSMFS